jgi:hypothetical protein
MRAAAGRERPVKSNEKLIIVAKSHSYLYQFTGERLALL